MINLFEGCGYDV